MDLREIGWGDMDWICLALDRDQWRLLATTVPNLLMLKNCVSSSVSEQLAASQGLSYTDLMS
jgi:hypothetical protein